MPSCVACKNNSKSAKGKGISFFRFPCETQRRDAWIEELGLKDWIPNPFSRICSEHFEDCCFENSVPDMRQRTQLKKFSIPTIFNEVLVQRRAKWKRKKRKLKIEGNSAVIKSDPSNLKDESRPAGDPFEVRLIFTEKREIETNEKSARTVRSGLGSSNKKIGRKKKFEGTPEEASNPGKRNALEEFKEKCGLGLSQERISSLKLKTLVPLEHNYFVHESAKLLKIKLTQAQEELQEVKTKLEKCKQTLRLERRKRVRSIEKTRKLATSLNGIKVESHKQKQIISKFNFLFESDGEKIDDSVANLNRKREDVDLSKVGAEGVDQNDILENESDALAGLELARGLSLFGRKGQPDELKNFASTLKRISPKAYEYIKDTLGLATAAMVALSQSQAQESKTPLQKKRRPGPKGQKSRRKVNETEQMSGSDLHDQTAAAEFAPEMISLQIIHDEGLDGTEQDHRSVVSTEVSQFEFVPQAFEIIPTSFSASQDPSTNCLYYAIDPSLNQSSAISWP